MSKLISSSASHGGPRPASTSAVSRITKITPLVAKDTRKRRRSSSSMDNSSATAVQRALFTVAGLSSSLDAESGLEEPFHESNASPPTGMKDFSTALDKQLSSSLFSEDPASNFGEKTNQKKKSIMKRTPSNCTPGFKLKPRPQHRLKIDLCRTTTTSSSSTSTSTSSTLRSSFTTPPPRIFLPFLPSIPKQAPTALPGKKETLCKQKPLPPPPLIPQFFVPAPSASASSADSKINRVMKDPEKLLRPKKMRRTMTGSRPLSSPPQLITSFDFGISVATRDLITPPPTTKRPVAPFRSPPSIMITHTPLSNSSVETIYNNNKDGGIVVAKPIARRPLITPSNRNNSNNTKINNKFAATDSPNPIFRSMLKQERTNAASSLSSIQGSAFSFSSSVPSSLLHATIRRTLSEDDEE